MCKWLCKRSVRDWSMRLCVNVTCVGCAESEFCSLTVTEVSALQLQHDAAHLYTHTCVPVSWHIQTQAHVFVGTFHRLLSLLSKSVHTHNPLCPNAMCMYRYAHLICTDLVFLPLIFSVDLMKYHMTNTEYHIHTRAHTFIRTHKLTHRCKSKVRVKGHGGRDTACRNIPYTQ